MGAVMTLRPDLWRTIVAKVPFVDVVNTMSDPTIPLTAIEWEQWGNPIDSADDFAYMLSYSPYENLRPTDYPNLMLTAGFNDPRVQYWEPAKFCARLRALKTDSNRLIMRTNMDAGHAGASGRFDHLREIALEWAFILDTLGLADVEPQLPPTPST
jgi:oligopeptidase B